MDREKTRRKKRETLYTENTEIGNLPYVLHTVRKARTAAWLRGTRAVFQNRCVSEGPSERAGLLPGPNEKAKRMKVGKKTRVRGTKEGRGKERETTTPRARVKRRGAIASIIRCLNKLEPVLQLPSRRHLTRTSL